MAGPADAWASLEAFDAAAPPEPVGLDGFFEFFFGATDAAGLAASFEAFETACGELELAAYGLGATDALCLAGNDSQTPSRAPRASADARSWRQRVGGRVGG